MTAVFLIGVCGVEDQQNGLCKVLIMLSVISSCGVVPKREYIHQSQELLMKWNIKFEILLVPALLTSYSKVSRLCLPCCKIPGKAVPLQAWSDPEASRKLRFPDFMTTAQDGGKVVRLMHQLPLHPGTTLGTHFC